MTHHCGLQGNEGKIQLIGNGGMEGAEKEREKEVCIILKYYQHHIRAQRALKTENCLG